MKVFYSVSLVGFHSSDMGGGLHLAISFQPSQKVRRWEQFSSLMFGNLVCLSPRGRFNQVGNYAVFLVLVPHLCDAAPGQNFDAAPV
jgi:hypothetical protein